MIGRHTDMLPQYPNAVDHIFSYAVASQTEPTVELLHQVAGAKAKQMATTVNQAIPEAKCSSRRFPHVSMLD
jgi:hypothetical protein